MTMKSDSRARGALPRVVQIGKYYPPHVGGIETHLKLLCESIRDKFDVRALVASGTRYGGESIVDGVAVTRAATIVTIGGSPVCPSMISTLKTLEPDIIHVHLPNPAAELTVMAARTRAAIVATWHSDVVRQRRLARMFAPIEQRFLARCAAIIATSANYIDSSELLCSLERRPVVIPYGIDASEYAAVPDAAGAAIKSRYRAPILLAVGRLVYYKGFEYAIRAMAKIDATLLIVGDGPLRAALEAAARAAGVSDRVVFIGEMQPAEIIPYYHACEVFVLPSIARSEAFGIVQLEAMACGKPVVNTRLDSGVPFASIDGVTGLTVEPRNVEALATAINVLLADDAMRRRFGEAGRARVEAEFSVAAMARRMTELYASIIARGVPR